MIINLKNLTTGIHWWKKNNWPEDFHNSIYADIYNIRAGGITEQWWSTTVDRLSQWRAYRGRKRPNTKAEITARGLKYLIQINVLYKKLLERSAGEPNITCLTWEDVDTLFSLISEIKPGSPVFAGKMGHFLFPRVFIVMDTLATSVFDYEFYWRGMREEWHRFAQKEEARNILVSSVTSGSALHPLYPMETKIMELSHIGYKCERRNMYFPPSEPPAS